MLVPEEIDEKTKVYMKRRKTGSPKITVILSDSCQDKRGRLVKAIFPNNYNDLLSYRMMMSNDRHLEE